MRPTIALYVDAAKTPTSNNQCKLSPLCTTSDLDHIDVTSKAMRSSIDKSVRRPLSTWASCFMPNSKQVLHVVKSDPNTYARLFVVSHHALYQPQLA